jgi:hypothetical protein
MAAPRFRTAVVLTAALMLGACDGNMSESELTTAIEQAVTELNGRTPMRVDPVTTLTRVRAEGTKIIYEMAVSQEIPGEQIPALRQSAQASNQANLCRDENSGRLIRMGASMAHIYTDPSGDRFETNVTACPPATASG